MRRPSATATAGPVAAVVAAMVVAVLAVLFVLAHVSAFTPDGRTRCGPALQEWRNLFDGVGGRCHEARRDRLWLGIQVAVAMAAAGGLAYSGVVAVSRRRGR